MNVFKALHSVCAMHALMLSVSGRSVQTSRDESSEKELDLETALEIEADGEEETAADRQPSIPQMYTTVKHDVTDWFQTTLGSADKGTGKVDDVSSSQPDAGPNLVVVEKRRSRRRRNLEPNRSRNRRRHKSTVQHKPLLQQKPIISTITGNKRHSKSKSRNSDSVLNDENSDNDNNNNNNIVNSDRESAIVRFLNYVPRSVLRSSGRAIRSATLSQESHEIMLSNIGYEATLLKLHAKIMFDLYASHPVVQSAVSIGFADAKHLSRALLANPGYSVPPTVNHTVLTTHNKQNIQDHLNSILQLHVTYKKILDHILDLESSYVCRNFQRSCDLDRIVRQPHGSEEMFYAKVHPVLLECISRQDDLITLISSNMVAMDFEVQVNRDPEIPRVASEPEVHFRNYALAASYAIRKQSKITEAFVTQISHEQYER